MLTLPADTTDDTAVRAAIARTAGELGGVDILVNNAAVPATQGSPRALADLVDGDLLAAIDAKVLGYLRCARAAAPYMTAQGWGRIINISGLAARSVSTPSGSIRNVAVAALTKTLADELGPAGVNVTVVHPGLTATERTPAMIADTPPRTAVPRPRPKRAWPRASASGASSPLRRSPTWSPSSRRPAAWPSTATPSPPAAVRQAPSTTEREEPGCRFLL